MVTSSQAVRVQDPDRSLQSLLVADTHGAAHLTRAIGLVPLAVFVPTFAYLVVLMGRSDWENLSLFAVLLSSIWLVAGPYLLMNWRRRIQQLESHLSDCLECPPQFSSKARDRLGVVQWMLILLAPGLMIIAFQTGDAFFGEALGLARSGVTFWAAQSVLVIGGIVAGLGLARAAVTLHLGRALAVAPSSFDPYAGVMIEASHHLADFCFRAALLFGLGGSLLMPGIIAGAAGSTEVARITLALVVFLIVGVTAALLAVPALHVSNRYATERDLYLASLSKEIGSLAERATSPGQGFTNDDYVRLRALLELRSHVVERSIPPPAVEMTRRIPLAVVLPILSVAASWASAFAS